MNEPTPKRDIPRYTTSGKTYLEWYWDVERTKREIRGDTVEGQDLEGWRELQEPKHKPLKRVWEAIRKTAAGETTVGVIGAEIKDLIAPFVPYGHTIDAITDVVGAKLKTSNDMAKSNKVTKWLKQKSTKEGITLVVSLVAMLLPEVSPEMLGEAVNQITQGAGALIAGILGLKRMIIDKDPEESE